MEGITTMTQKGQITIPASIRKLARLKPYGRVWVKFSNGTVKVEPVIDILDMAGSVKPLKSRSVLKVREEMEKNYKRV